MMSNGPNVMHFMSCGSGKTLSYMYKTSCPACGDVWKNGPTCFGSGNWYCPVCGYAWINKNANYFNIQWQSELTIDEPPKFEKILSNLSKPCITRKISIIDKEITLGELGKRYNFEIYTFFHRASFSKFPPIQVYDPEYKIAGPLELTVFDNNVIYIK